MTPTRPTDAQRIQSRRAFGFVLMSALLPGSVQILAGSRRVGRVATRVFGAAALLAGLVLVGLLVLRGPTVGLLLQPWLAMTLRAALWLLFVFWLVLLLDAWRMARPLRLERRARLALSITALVTVLAVAAVTSTATEALVAARNVGQVFGGGGDSRLKNGRLNILLLGSDSSESREGLRPDSINVASIDARTGRTILFGLPRNLQRVPFPDSSPLDELYPDGFECEDGACMLNGIWTLGEENADLYPGRQAGLEATKEAVEETLGLELNYYVLVDMQGFQSLIDAMGGITLDVGRRIPIGGANGVKVTKWIEPGEDVLLDGYHALWFARSRSDSSDYERMLRQKCVMSAMVAQLDPMTLATKFVRLSEAGKDLLRTDIGTGAINDLAELALLVRDQGITSVDFVPPLIVAAEPDFDLIRTRVAGQLADEPAAEPTKSPEATAGPSTAAPASSRPAAPETSPGPTSASPRPQATDLAPVCTVG
ncbi:LCP family protein [Tessaracoccus sp. Z1128]